MAITGSPQLFAIKVVDLTSIRRLVYSSDNKLISGNSINITSSTSIMLCQPHIRKCTKRYAAPPKDRVNKTFLILLHRFYAHSLLCAMYEPPTHLHIHWERIDGRIMKQLYAWKWCMCISFTSFQLPCMAMGGGGSGIVDAEEHEHPHFSAVLIYYDTARRRGKLN